MSNPSNSITYQTKGSCKLTVNEEFKNLNPYQQNLEIKEALWAHGFYVQEIGDQCHIDYLVVTCATPRICRPGDRISKLIP